MVADSTPKPPIQHSYPSTPSWWTGHNAHLSQYYVAPGYPPYDAHPRYFGELKGSWYDIGKQYGQRAGDLIRYTYEGWYDEILPRQKNNDAIRGYLREEEMYYSVLVPEALELMRGMADGAKEDLDGSRYAGTMSNYEKILMINSYYGLLAQAPACSGAVVFGSATKDGKAIHVSSEDQHFFPQEYLVTFIAVPADPHAHRFTVTDTAGEIGSEHAMNDRGVTVSGYAGGFEKIVAPTAASPFSGYRRAGLDWQVGDFYAAAFARSAKEAVELLTVGRPEYRQKSGKKIVIGKCARGVN
jgi:hypothetical protein